jgi:PAS domain S-box-containing protein
LKQVSQVHQFDPASEIDAPAVIEAAVESILITTPDLDAPGPSIIYVNPAFERMTGWSMSEVCGRSPRILQGPQTDHRVFSDMRDRLLRGQIWEGQTVNYKKDGAAFWMEWSIVPLKDNENKTYQYLAIQRDISGRIEADRKLQEARAAERKAERARANLARYFSPNIVETLAVKDQPLGPVRRQNLAVLFADIMGFTGISETVEPEQVIELLREVHSWTEKIIFKWEGSIEAYIGDAVLAIFGFPETTEQDPANALLCAYDLLNANRSWNEKRTRAGLLPLHLGMGLQYGPVVLGDVGSEDFVEFTVIGDTVNTASRLQQATRTLECNLVAGDQLVNAIAKDRNDKNLECIMRQLQYYSNFAIRGRSNPVDIWTAAITT